MVSSISSMQCLVGYHEADGVRTAKSAEFPKVSYISDENAFRWAFNGDACAVEKSAEAMRKFAEDTEKLKLLLAEKL